MALCRLPDRYEWRNELAREALRRSGCPAADTTGAAAASAGAPKSEPADAGSTPDADPVPDAHEPEWYASGDQDHREEPSCAELPDASAIERDYRPGARRAAAQALATTRYPAGLAFLKAQNDAQLSAWFVGAPDSFAGVASRFDAAVHEGSHIWSFRRFDLGKQIYSVRADREIAAKRLRNFARSEILSVHADREGDSYAKTYLEGASGAQGFNSLLDEYNAYAHSLASRYCTRDLLPPGSRVSAKDGILTFMYYVETYLELARTRHADDYRAIIADPGHRKLIVTIWDRAELWLRRSASEDQLGVADDKIRQWVYEPARLREIARVREADTNE